MEQKVVKTRVIKAVQIIHQHPEGPDYYEVGLNYRYKKITDIVENGGTIWIFDENDEIIIEIRNCPVVIYYTDAENEE